MTTTQKFRVLGVEQGITITRPFNKEIIALLLSLIAAAAGLVCAAFVSLPVVLVLLFGGIFIFSSYMLVKGSF